MANDDRLGELVRRELEELRLQSNKLFGVKCFGGQMEESWMDFIETYDQEAEAEGWSTERRASELRK